ncbi:carbonic anhydrase [Ancylobacter dichloromethanicus]|uniref:Carbonic anhydrase n=1 Tax=Ancylobacter dichloromethanicus TaxID=518825 RepID=A0A9W6JDP7_9HYPH|nr:carbonic anhydrase [Ancylobacter dichloromethanicus]MBS7552116.1 carbonic anhydrase [Ancylobacter dichloromethanicus]GLK73849.1 carbonic anhydrase [Ancylobacter dichloromethanicus]
MDKLLNGYRRFRATSWPERKALFERLAALGQKPDTLVIACSDSRVDPTMIFDAGPGELFVVRNVANLVPPYLTPDHQHHGTSAAIEFAVRVLEVREIVVLGHALCGGAGALVDGAPPQAQDFLPDWIRIAGPARDIALKLSDDPAERRTILEYECVKLSLRNLETFPWVRERIEDGRLTLQGAYFAVATGVLERLRPDGAFQPA